MKVLSQQGTFVGVGVTIGGGLTTADNATVLRIYNSGATIATVNIIEWEYPYTYNTIATISIPAGKVEYIQKKPEQYVEGDNTTNNTSPIYFTKIAYSPVMQYATWLEGGGGGPGGGGSIVTNGLIMHMDPGDTNSYSGSGTTWYDLTSNGNDWTISGAVWGNDTIATSTKVFNVTYSNGGNPYLVMNADISTNITNADHTIMVASRYTSTVNQRRERILQNYQQNPNWFLGNHQGDSGSHYAGGYIGSSSGQGEDNTAGSTAWAIYTGSVDVDFMGGYADLWVNGTKHANNDTSWSTGPERLAVGGSYGYDSDSDSAVGVILIYDRQLTDSEVLQNYEALKPRYGITY